MKKFLVMIPMLVATLFGQVELNSDITVNTTWTADNEYLLTKQVFIKAPAVLTIEPGVTVKAAEDDGAGLAPALIVERGAKIMAAGTESAPITFTSNKSAEELVANPRGNWGGIIILGKAPIATTGGENYVEGIVGNPYGGNDPDDNSGVLRYIRIWHGGRSIGQDNEINGLTLAGVGRGTTIDHLEIAYNLDDGIEFFGGNVDIKYVDVLFVGDDAFDVDEGYQGRGQFLFGMVGENAGNRGYEMDNKTNDNMNSQPRSYPQFYNVTLIGSGNPDAIADNDQVIRLREGVGGVFKNTIITDGKEYGVNITDGATLALIGDSLIFSSNNIIYNCTDGQFKDNYNLTALSVDPQFAAINGRETGGLIDPRPAASGPAYQNVDAVPSDDFFTSVTFKGAFDDNLWLSGWSYLYENGRLPYESGVAPVSETPSHFHLLSNYPNPFNPATQLRFNLESSADVTLQVFDLSGALIQSMTFGMMTAGYHQLTFDSQVLRLTSGVYLYKITAGNKSQFGKMTLLK